MKKIFAVIIISLIGLLPLSAEQTADFTLENLPDTLQFGLEYSMDVLVYIAPGWHINSGDPGNSYSVPTRFSIEENSPVNFNISKMPQGKMENTSWGESLYLYDGLVKIPAVLLPAEGKMGNVDFTVTMRYQACNDVSCLAPETVSKIFTVHIIKDTLSQIEPELASADLNDNSEINTTITQQTDTPAQTTQNPFEGRSIVLVLFSVFALGLGLNLTPCVYPLIPITMSYFISQKSSRSPVGLAVAYVVGLAITYSILGTLAALGGSMMGSLLANPITLIIFALIMLALSLSMFGVYEFKLPDKLVQGGGGSKSGIPGALIMGLTMGIVAAPCVGPFVVSLLAFVAQKGSVIIGFTTFFVLALGLGVPYLFLGIFSAKIDSMPRSGEWLNGIRIFFGLALIAMAIYFVSPLLSSGLQTWLLPVYMIAAAFYYGVFDSSGKSSVWFLKVKTFISMVVLAMALMTLIPAVSLDKAAADWQNYDTKILQKADQEDQKVIIDFYADWCNPCKELEHMTFSDPRVVEALENYTLLKVDLTTANAYTDSLRKVYNIAGVPTIMFLDADGKEVTSLKLNGFEEPEKFLKRLKNEK